MKGQRKKWRLPIAAGCLCMYAVLMFLAVWLMKMKYTENFKQKLISLDGNIQRDLGEKAQIEAENENYTEEMWKDYVQYTLNENIGLSGEPFLQFSAAVYDTDGNLTARTDDCVMIHYASEDSQWRAVYEVFAFPDLSEEELLSMAEYDAKSYANPELPPKYQWDAWTSWDQKELYELYMQELDWEKQEEGVDSYYENPLTGSSAIFAVSGDTNYILTDSRTVWKWEQPGMTEEELEKKKGAGIMSTVIVSFPYTENGYGAWNAWRNNSYLQGLPEKIDPVYHNDPVVYADFGQRSGDEDRIRTSIYMPGAWEYRMQGNLSAFCHAEVRSVSHPWLAALDYMKYVLAAGFALMLLCMGVIIYSTERIYEKKAALEEARRDFTNAMAHELKTPLGIIRGFAENLKEHTMEEKRDYYVEKIIDQTEEMDDLVAKMIEVSRLDSEHLVLQKEQVSISALFRQEEERFAEILREREITVQYEGKEGFIITGDREYLQKAVHNLLSNAVSHNVPGGRIRIINEKNQCRIENTADPLTEEQLSHAFDLFYSGDKSRTLGEKHLGLGLYLTRRICSLHQLHIGLENIPDGVRVTVSRKF